VRIDLYLVRNLRVDSYYRFAILKRHSPLTSTYTDLLEAADRITFWQFNDRVQCGMVAVVGTEQDM